MLLLQRNALHLHATVLSVWLTCSIILIIQISLLDNEEIGENRFKCHHYDSTPVLTLKITKILNTTQQISLSAVWMIYISRMAATKGDFAPHFGFYLHSSLSFSQRYLDPLPSLTSSFCPFLPSTYPLTRLSLLPYVSSQP